MAVYRPKYKDPETGELVQSAVWWYEFNFAGRRVRESTKSTRKTIATLAEENRRKELQRAYAGQGASEAPTQRVRTVKNALAAYQMTYPINHREKSVAVVKERSPHLEKRLGALLMPDLTENRIMKYMADRKAEGASNRTINMELAVLSFHPSDGRFGQVMRPNLCGHRMVPGPRTQVKTCHRWRCWPVTLPFHAVSRRFAGR